MASFEDRGKSIRVIVSVMKDGERQKVKKTFKKNKGKIPQEARKWAINMESDKINGKNLVASNMLFSDYFNFWMKTYKKNEVRESTYKAYEIASHTIESMFKDIKIDNLTYYILQSRLDEFGKELKKSYVKKVVTKIKASLKDALYDEYITKDIFSRLTAHGLESEKKINYLSATEFEKLREYLYSKELNERELAILISLETGMRMGEVRALQMKDISIPFKNISVTKSYAFRVKKITKPKNKTSERNIKVTDELIQKIAERNIKEDEFLIKHSIEHIAYQLKKIIKELDLHRITPHGLRHSHVSYLLYHGVSLNYISSRLGHKNIAITQQVYAHMLEEEEQSETEKTLDILSTPKINSQKKDLHSM